MGVSSCWSLLFLVALPIAGLAAITGSGSAVPLSRYAVPAAVADPDPCKCGVTYDNVLPYDDGVWIDINPGHPGWFRGVTAWMTPSPGRCAQCSGEAKGCAVVHNISVSVPVSYQICNGCDGAACGGGCSGPICKMSFQGENIVFAEAYSIVCGFGHGHHFDLYAPGGCAYIARIEFGWSCNPCSVLPQ